MVFNGNQVHLLNKKLTLRTVRSNLYLFNKSVQLDFFVWLLITVQ